MKDLTKNTLVSYLKWNRYTLSILKANIKNTYEMIHYSVAIGITLAYVLATSKDKTSEKILITYKKIINQFLISNKINSNRLLGLYAAFLESLETFEPNQKAKTGEENLKELLRNLAKKPNSYQA